MSWVLRYNQWVWINHRTGQMAGACRVDEGCSDDDGGTTCKEYEMLPIIENVGILRNIIYSGIWEAYYSTTNRRCGDEE